MNGHDAGRHTVLGSFCSRASECQQHLAFRTIQACPKDLPPGLREIELRPIDLLGRLRGG
jgi:hypothetical protein